MEREAQYMKFEIYPHSTFEDKEKLIRSMLAALGEDIEREGLIETPKRVVKSWDELYGGYSLSPEDILKKDFAEGACDQMIVLRDIEFNSTCEHHIIPIIGKAHVAYIPNGKVVGISKLARIVDAYARRLQIQEKMTEQIAEVIMNVLQPKGVGVMIEAQHMCMTSRGIKKPNVSMVTSALRGVFELDEVRQEFLKFIR